MTDIGKLTIASAMLALTAGGANALDLSVGGGASASVGVETSSSATEAEAATGGSVMASGPAAAAVEAATDAMGRGEAAIATSSEGVVLGTVNDASADATGAAQFSITLDPALDLEANRITFRGAADVTGDGQIVLPMTQAEFVSAVQANSAASLN